MKIPFLSSLLVDRSTLTLTMSNATGTVTAEAIWLDGLECFYYSIYKKKSWFRKQMLEEDTCFSTNPIQFLMDRVEQYIDSEEDSDQP